MATGNFWKSVSTFESGLSATEWAWKIFALLFISASGTITAFLAKADPVLKELGPFYWVGIGILTGLALR